MTQTLLVPGTNGWLHTPVDLLTTELNGLAAGAAATSSVGGTSGVFNQTSFNTTNGPPLLETWFTSGGTFTPAAGQALMGWCLKSIDGGTTFESLVATPSTTVPALSRNPDFVIPLDNAAYASANIRFGTILLLPAPYFKVVLQNFGATALPASGNKVTVGPYTYQQV